MSEREKHLKAVQDELKWVTISEKRFTFYEKLLSKGITGFLVPVGCVVTTGVLVSGVYQMVKRDSRKQQVLMRYRVLAQGVTVLLAAVGVFNLKFSG